MASSKLYRSRNHRVVGGVCGGLAEHFGWEDNLVRVAAVVLVLVPGPNFPLILAYVAAWATIPLDPTNQAEIVDHNK